MLSIVQKRLVVVTLVLISAHLFCSTASAETTRYIFKVTLDYVDNYGFLDDTVSPGSEATGYFTFDPTGAQTIATTSDSKFYVLSSNNGLTLNLGGYVYRSSGEVNLQIAKYSGHDAYTFDFNGPYWLTANRVYLDFWGPEDQCFINTEVNDPGFPGDFACYTEIHNMLVSTPDFELFGRWHSMAIAVGPPTTKEDCKDNRWQSWDFPRVFRNQGDCVSYVNTGN